VAFLEGRPAGALTVARAAFAVAFAVASASLVLTCAIGRGTYRPEPWLEDLDALEAHMGRVYANLEWSVERRGIDLPELDHTTRELIRSAG
jgi:hypothetical protein